MSENEMNSAEAAAEEIFKAAAEDIQAESCPQGRECPVHFRVDEEYIAEGEQYARMITYVGEFVVITDDNPDAVTLESFMSFIAGKGLKVDDGWETCIYHVGDQAISHLTLKSDEEKRKAFRYRSTHDEWSLVPATHRAVVSALGAGLIDVSKPWEVK